MTMLPGFKTYGKNNKNLLSCWQVCVLVLSPEITIKIITLNLAVKSSLSVHCLEEYNSRQNVFLK